MSERFAMEQAMLVAILHHHVETEVCVCLCVCVCACACARVSLIVPIPKKGDLSCCDNWRGISLLDVGGGAFHESAPEKAPQDG